MSEQESMPSIRSNGIDTKPKSDTDRSQINQSKDRRESALSFADSSSSSSSSENLNIPTRVRKKKEKQTPTKKKSTRVENTLNTIHQALTSKKEQLAQQPTVTLLKGRLDAKKQIITSHSKSVSNRVEIFLSPLNTFLRKVILDWHQYVKEASSWLDGNLPDKVLAWFDPIPEDEKELFKIHKPSGLSMCFFALNLALLLLGLLVFLTGITVIVHPYTVNKLIKQIDTSGRLSSLNIRDFLGSFTIFVILSGASLIGLGYLGTIGCILGQRQMLKAYATIIGSIIALQVAFTLFVLLNFQRLERRTAESMKRYITTDYDGAQNSTNSFTIAWDVIQWLFDCCGVTDHRDFVGSPWFIEANKKKVLSGNTTDSEYKFPLTCCKSLTERVPKMASELADSDCQKNNASFKNPNTLQPCMKAIRQWLFNKILMVMGFLLSFVGLEVSVITNALAIVKAINKTYAKSRKKKKKKKKQRLKKNKDRDSHGMDPAPPTEAQQTKERGEPMAVGIKGAYQETSSFGSDLSSEQMSLTERERKENLGTNSADIPAVNIEQQEQKRGSIVRNTGELRKEKKISIVLLEQKIRSVYQKIMKDSERAEQGRRSSSSGSSQASKDQDFGHKKQAIANKLLEPDELETKERHALENKEDDGGKQAPMKEKKKKKKKKKKFSFTDHLKFRRVSEPMPNDDEGIPVSSSGGRSVNWEENVQTERKQHKFFTFRRRSASKGLSTPPACTSPDDGQIFPETDWDERAVLGGDNTSPHNNPDCEQEGTMRGKRKREGGVDSAREEEPELSDILQENDDRKSLESSTSENLELRGKTPYKHKTDCRYEKDSHNSLPDEPPANGPIELSIIFDPNSSRYPSNVNSESSLADERKQDKKQASERDDSVSSRANTPTHDVGAMGSIGSNQPQSSARAKEQSPRNSSNPSITSSGSFHELFDGAFMRKSFSLYQDNSSSSSSSSGSEWTEKIAAMSK